MIIDGDEFVKKPSEILKHVEQFLGIPEFFSPASFVFTGWFETWRIVDCKI